MNLKPPPGSYGEVKTNRKQQHCLSEAEPNPIIQMDALDIDADVYALKYLYGLNSILKHARILFGRSLFSIAA